MSRPKARESGQVAYQALAADLREEIAGGRFPPDRRLPTEAELSARYGVSRQTVRRALQDLVAEGLVFRVRGRGTYATQASPDGRFLQSVGSIDDLLSFAFDTLLETVEPLQLRTAIEAASRLQLPSDHVVAGVFRRLHDGAPFGVIKVFLPPEIGRPLMGADALPDVDESRRSTFISHVEKTLAHPLTRANQSINATPVPAELAHHIDLSPGDPVLLVDRLYFDARGKPIMLAISWFHPDRYTYRLSLRRNSRMEYPRR